MRVCAWNGKTFPQLKNTTCVFVGICVQGCGWQPCDAAPKKEGVYPQGGDKDYKRIMGVVIGIVYLDPKNGKHNSPKHVEIAQKAITYFWGSGRDEFENLPYRSPKIWRLLRISITQGFRV